MVDSPKDKKAEDSSDKPDTYGFEHCPERRKEHSGYSLWQVARFKDSYDRYCRTRCEENVLDAVKKNPLIKILMGALKQAGCPVNLQRHIVCEECDNRVTGGYDVEFNQIVICQNSKKARENPEVTLIHELIHMYDYCVGEIDFKNLEHMACTEIRAANIAHCSFLSTLAFGESSPINIKKTHQYCVKLKAAQSMMLGRGIDFPSAMDIILKVFDKCYNDLEPIGRRIRRRSIDPLLAYREGQLYGYCE